MKEPNYSKRELDHYFKDIKSTLEDQNVILKEIREQTIKTNGRVSILEQWRTAIAWGFGVLVTITIFLFNYFK